MDRTLNWPACLNVRDLGGLPCVEGGRTKERVIVRADDLARLTPEGQTALRDYGVRTVIDLRSDREAESTPSPFSTHSPVTYRRVPLISDAEWDAIRANPLPPHEADVRTLQLSTAEIVAVMSLIARAGACLVVHCSAGLERTGLVAMLLLAITHVPDELIADDYIESIEKLGPLFAARLKRGPGDGERAGLSRWIQELSDPRHVLATLGWLHGRGGATEYLARGGMPRDDLGLLGSRLGGGRS